MKCCHKMSVIFSESNATHRKSGFILCAEDYAKTEYKILKNSLQIK